MPLNALGRALRKWLSEPTDTRHPDEVASPPASENGAAARGPKNAPAYRCPPGQIVYAIGDIHGRLDLLLELEQAIQTDFAKRHAEQQRDPFMAAEPDPPPLTATIVYLGDYVDRGSQSKQVLDHLIAGPPDGFNAIHLKGNHEEAFLTFFDEPENGRHWMFQGGAETLLSYDVPVFGTGQSADGDTDLETASSTEWLVRARDHMQSQCPDRHRQFMHTLRLHCQIGDYLFVHAGVRPGRALAEQGPEDLLWIREPFLSHGQDYDGLCVVHGHTITDTPEFRTGRIGLDTGAYRTDRLTCLILQDDLQDILQTRIAAAPPQPS